MSTTSAGGAPLVHVRASYGSEQLVVFVAAPGAPPSSLGRPGTALVIRADSTANLQITVQAVANGTLDAELKLEPIDGAREQDLPVGHVPGPEMPASRAPGPNGIPVQTLELLAHVSRRGDVSAASGRWIAGPEGPAPIEGIAARWPSGNGDHLEYQVLVDGAQTWSEWVGDWLFAGTRGEALALVGVRFRLSGSGSHTLKASALFLGSAVMEKYGSSIELRSAAGFDPLVGLSLESVAATKPVPPLRTIEPSYVQPESRGRVRVFRAGGEQT